MSSNFKGAFISHPIISLIMFVVITLAIGKVAALFFIIGYFLSREIAQSEYIWIEKYGNGLRSNMPWWGRFDPRVWSELRIFEIITPILTAIILFHIF